MESVSDVNLRLSLLYVLAKRGINLEKLLDIEKMKESELRDKNLVMMAAIVESIAEREGAKKEECKELLNKTKERFLQNYKVEDEGISKLVNSLDSELVETLYKVFRKEIETNLPNPF